MADRRGQPPMNKWWLDHQRRNGRQQQYMRRGKRPRRDAPAPMVINTKTFLAGMRVEWGRFNQADRELLSTVMGEAHTAEADFTLAMTRNQNSIDRHDAFLERSHVLYESLTSSRELINRVRIAGDTEEGILNVIRSRDRLNASRGLRRALEDQLTALRAGTPATAAAERNANLRDTSRQEDGWHGFNILETTSQGVVGYWRTDGHGTPVERVAVKDSYLPAGHWYMPMLWEGNVHDPAKQPREVEVMLNISCDKIVGLRSWAMFESRMMHRIYMEFCRYGDLFSSRVAYNRGPAPRRSMPEPFLWYLFECLAEAGVAMLQGSTTVATPGWRQVVHRDIKTENIFLGEPSDTNYPLYPTAKLGDFGFAIRTDAADALNPGSYVAWGTLDHMAPEQMFLSHQLSSHTNVWEIGVVLMVLMTNDFDIGSAARRPAGQRDPPILYRAGMERCTAPLEDLVRRCVQEDPNNRIPVQELLFEIRKHTRYAVSAWGAVSREDYAYGMRRETGFNASPAFALARPNILAPDP